MTPQEFMQACADGADERVAQGLAQGLDPWGQPNEVSPLYEAVENGRQAVVHLLLTAGVAVDHRLRSHGVSVLVPGLYAGSTMVALLLKAGANPRPETWARSAEAEGLIPAAAHHDDPEMLELLLDAGADLHTTDGGHTRRTALHVAAWLDKPRLIPELVRRGLNIQAQDASGFTPLHWAVRGGHDRAVKALLEQGADVFDQGGTVQSPLAMAQGSHPRVLDLVDASARIPQERAALRDVLATVDTGTTERGRRRL